MKMRTLFLTASAALALTTGAMAQGGPGPNDDPNGYYSQSDHSGYYDRDGHYQRFGGGNGGYDQDGPQNGGPGYGPPPDNGPPPINYEQGRYEENCHRGNNAAGTLFGAIAGGLIGGAASHGNGGAVAGGVILGGLFGNTISRDLDCDDHRYALNVYSSGLNGRIGERTEWRNDQNGDYGYFTPLREYYRGRTICRDFTTVTYRHGEASTRTGTSCRASDGEWRFD